jgi:hypothetical protein
MSDRETFFPNDRPILVFEARRPSIERFDDPDGVAAQPDDVEMKIFDGTSGEMVEVDGSTIIPLGIAGSNLFMTSMDIETDRGALIYVAIPGEVADVPGNYTLYITTTYGDGLRITHDQKVQISEYK